MKVKIVQQPGAEPVPAEIIAQSVKDIAEALRKLRDGRLNDRALVLLIQHAAPSSGPHSVSGRQVRTVLDAIENLERTYLRKAG